MRVGEWRDIGLLSRAIWCSAGFDNSLNEAEAVHAMEQRIRAIRAWMQADKLKLNENKTEVMLIGTRQQLSKVNLGTLTVGDTSVAIVNKARNLGVWFDSQLNFNVHITKTCSLSFCSLYKIRRIRKYLSYKSAQTLILALVIGRLDYCNSLLYGLPASYIIKLQQVQNVHLQYHASKLQSNYNLRSNTKHLGTVHFLRGRGGWWNFLNPHYELQWPPPTQSSFFLMPPPPPKDGHFFG